MRQNLILLCVMKNMIVKYCKLCALIFLMLGITSCKIFLKPKIEKFYEYESGKKYNTFKFFSAPFEIQLGENGGSVMHIELNHRDSMYGIDIVPFDSISSIYYESIGKYNIDEKGKVSLIGESPFLNNQFQIVVTKSHSSLFAEFKLNEKFSSLFTNSKRRAYCEADIPWGLRECVLDE